MNHTELNRVLATLLALLFLFLTSAVAAAAMDRDGDQIPDDVDNCSAYPNLDQIDIDGDGFGNACDADFNNDGIVDFLDASLFDDLRLSQDPLADLVFQTAIDDLDANRLQDLFFATPGPGAQGGSGDADFDGIVDAADNCSAYSNPDQLDVDNDGFGNACDADFNNDGLVDFLDASLFDDRRANQDMVADLLVQHGVDDADQARLQDLFFSEPGPGAVPEPSSSLLAAAALLTLASFSRCQRRQRRTRAGLAGSL